MGFDIVSYIMGKEKGRSEGVIVLEGTLVATDDGNGIITLTEVNDGE